MSEGEKKQITCWEKESMFLERTDFPLCLSCAPSSSTGFPNAASAGELSSIPCMFCNGIQHFRPFPLQWSPGHSDLQSVALICSQPDTITTVCPFPKELSMTGLCPGSMHPSETRVTHHIHLVLVSTIYCSSAQMHEVGEDPFQVLRSKTSNK